MSPNDWFGRTGQIAETHHLQVTNDYSLASIPTFVSEGQSEGQLLGHQQPPKEVTGSEYSGKSSGSMTAGGSGVKEKYTPLGSNQ